MPPPTTPPGQQSKAEQECTEIRDKALAAVNTASAAMTALSRSIHYNSRDYPVLQTAAEDLQNAVIDLMRAHAIMVVHIDYQH